MKNFQRQQAEQRAGDTLVHYFRTLFEHVGVPFEGDMETEIRSVVEDVIDGAVSEARSLET